MSQYLISPKRTGKSDVTCPNCQAELRSQEVADGWCDSCGKKIPAFALVDYPGYRPIVSLPNRPSRAFREKARKEASGVLFAVAILQFIGGLAALFMLGQMSGGGGVPDSIIGLAVIEWLGTTLVFSGLGCWARSNPQPALCFGLGLYLVLALIGFAIIPAMMLKGIVVKIVVVVLMIAALGKCDKA